MKEYITSYETTADYEAVKDTLATPHIAMVDEDMSIHYQKYVPVIRYKASAKLTETTDSFSNGLHTNAFNAAIVSHTFENGVGNIEFDRNVTIIGESAFRGCRGMTDVTLPDTVETISVWAFYECTQLTSMEIPNGVTSIGVEAFSGCVGLRNITIPRSVRSIGTLAFNNCTGLPVTNYIRYADTCAVTVTNKNLTTYTLKEGTRFIGSHLFYGCGKLVSVTIPKSVIDIGSMVFYGCNALTNITVEEDGSRFDSRNNCNAIIETSTNTLVQGCKNTVIPNSVTSIGNGAFSRCSGLTSITIPNSVTSIGNEAFYQCTSLTSITISNSVTNIGFAVFSGCTSLPVEDNIRYADTYAVEAIDKTLTSYTLKEGTRFIGDGAFYNCTGLTSIGGANSGASIQMPNSITHIEEDAFSSCTGLTSITIPASIRSIAHYFDEYGQFYRYSFLGCSSLISITVDGGNPIYDSRNGCNAIIETSTNTLILGCKNTVIPNTVTSIAPNSFYKCTGLTSIEIPNGVTSIGISAFYQCSSLTSITCNAATAPTIKNNTFRDVKTGGTLTVPTGSTGYDVWMGTGNYYLGKYNWTKVEQ